MGSVKRGWASLPAPLHVPPSLFALWQERFCCAGLTPHRVGRMRAMEKVFLQGPTREVMAQPEVLNESDVVVPPVVELSLAL